MDVDLLFCPIYDKHLNEMHAERSKVVTNKEKLTIMSKFASKFTVLPEELSEFARLCERCDQKFVVGDYATLYSKYYGDKNAKHIEWSGTNGTVSNLCYGTCKNRYQLLDEALMFPHKNLEELQQIRLFFSVYPMLTTVEKQLKSSKIIYNKIKECENDIAKWLECIKNIENKEVVIANLELKLGQDNNRKSKKLWKFYFDFLKENNMIEILDVFRKYTRLFVCGKLAVTSYRNELDKFSSWNIPTTKYWIDTIKFEIDFGTLESAYHILERALKAVNGKPYHFVVKDENDLLEKLIRFETKMFEIEKIQTPAQLAKNHGNEVTPFIKPATYYQNVKKQCFPFHQSFIHNLFKNACGTILRKLYASCKFFYSLQKAPLCYRLEINGLKKTHYCEESLFLNDKDINFIGLDCLHVYSMLVARCNGSRNLIPPILPKLKKCGIRYLNIEHQDFAVTDLKFMLTENIFRIILIDVDIKEEDGINISGKKLFKIFKNYSSLKYLGVFNNDYFIADCFYENDRIRKWKFRLESFRFKTIFIVHQTASISDFQMILDYELLKHVYLSNVTIKNENGSAMDTHQIEKFIKEKVNPLNNVVVEIV